jgi:hypothetical protein
MGIAAVMVARNRSERRMVSFLLVSSGLMVRK